MRSRYYHYFVEGECEKKLIDVLKTELQLVRAGKVQVFNAVQNRINKNRIRPLSRGTCVVLVFDTDVEEDSVLKENIAFLQQQDHISEVLCVMQVKNLEDELVRSCKKRLLLDKSARMRREDFKRNLLRSTNLAQQLREAGFDIKKMWIQDSPETFSEIENNGRLICFYANQ